MSLSDLFYLHKSDRRVLTAILLVAALALGGIILLDSQTEEGAEKQQTAKQSATSDRASTQSRQTFVYDEGGESTAPAHELFTFDPNTADSTQLLRLGLHPRQVRNIYRYRAAGGIYHTKEDFAQLYGLTLKEYRRLEPYIHIGADYQPAARFVKQAERDTLLFTSKLKEGEWVDLADADTSLLKKVPGIGPYYAHEIAKYRTRLGGFSTVDQLDEIDGFPVEAKKFFRIGKQPSQRMNVNRLTLNQLKRHPYINYYQARDIVDYRRLHGPLKGLDDLRLMRNFPAEAIERLAPYVEF